MCLRRLRRHRHHHSIQLPLHAREHLCRLQVQPRNPAFYLHLYLPLLPPRCTMQLYDLLRQHKRSKCKDSPLGAQLLHMRLVSLLSAPTRKYKT
jgi:hypothetical protein